MSVCLSRYAFGRASTYGAETWHGGRVWRAGGNRQLFVATRQVKGHLEVNLFRNALWLSNLVGRIPDQRVMYCWGQRSCRGHPGSNCLEMPYSHQIPGGHWPRKGVWGCTAVMTPFFQASRRSLAYQFAIIAPLLCPPFSNFRKIFNFQPCFGQNFSSQDANFPNFHSLDPSFFKENPLLRPYFLKPVWHIPTQKKVECPPRAPNLVGRTPDQSIMHCWGQRSCRGQPGSTRGQIA